MPAWWIKKEELLVKQSPIICVCGEGGYRIVFLPMLPSNSASYVHTLPFSLKICEVGSCTWTGDTALYREWSLITERGATTWKGGGASDVLPLQKKRGGGGRHNSFWGSFNTGAWSFSHTDWGGGGVKRLNPRFSHFVAPPPPPPPLPLYLMISPLVSILLSPFRWGLACTEHRQHRDICRWHLQRTRPSILPSLFWLWTREYNTPWRLDRSDDQKMCCTFHSFVVKTIGQEEKGVGVGRGQEMCGGVSVCVCGGGGGVLEVCGGEATF